MFFVDRSSTREASLFFSFFFFADASRPSPHFLSLSRSLARSLSQTSTTSVRSKRLLGLKNVDVYSLGFYVDPAALSSRHGKDSGSQNNTDQLLSEVVADAAVAKTLRVVVTTGMLNASRFVKGVRESLAPALAKVGAGGSMESFETIFEGLSLSKGTELVFSNVPCSGALRVRVGGKEVGVVSDKRFAPALFGLYFGPDSVSPSGREDIKAGIEKGLGGGREE